MIEFQEIISGYGLYFGTSVISIISGFVPFVNLELYLLFISPVIHEHQFILVAGIAAAGQIVTKIIMYLSAKGVISFSFKKNEEKIDTTIQKIQKWKVSFDAIVFISSFSGIPPLYVITIVAGMVRMNIVRFILWGLSGRFIRFELILYFPLYFKKFFT